MYVYDLNGNSLRTTTKLADGTTIAQSIVNGFGQTTVQAQASTSGFIYTRSEYNAKGQMTKQYQDTGWNTAKTAATLYEYDVFGNVSKQTLALADSPTKDNAPMVEMAYSVESAEDGVFSVTTQTRYNAAGEPLNSSKKQLISQLSAILESKTIKITERGLTNTQWATYNEGTKRSTYSTLPTSTLTEEIITVDGVVMSKKDHTGIIMTATRNYTAMGIALVHVDGRGNATISRTDLAGRTISVTDASGAVTTTAYDAAHDLPAVVTDAEGNTACYKYDHRGRKIAEWGTAIQPACFGYDDMGNMTTLRTFRAGTEIISTNPSERTDGDVTMWAFHPATGLELSKTYADGTTVVKTYDAYNRLATETDARGNIKTHAYEHARGLHLGTTYTLPSQSSEGATAGAAANARSFTYNHLGQVTQLTDDSGVRTFTYNSYGEEESDSLVVDGDTHLVTELRDGFGRSTGYRNFERSLSDVEENFLKSSAWVKPLEKKKGILHRLGLRYREPHPPLWNKLIGRFVPTMNNMSILPVFVRTMQSNFPASIEKIGFIREGRRLFLVCRDGGSDFKIEVGLYRFEESIIDVAGEKYRVRALGGTVTENGETSYRIELAYPELPNSMRLTLRLIGKDVIDIRTEEKPGSKIVDTYLTDALSLDGRMRFVKDMIEGRLGRGYINKKALGIFERRITAVKEGALNFEELMERERASADTPLQAERSVASLVLRFVGGAERSEGNFLGDLLGTVFGGFRR